jgi:prophage antirepressor-like protein
MTNLQVVKQQEVLGKGFTVYGTFEDPMFLAKDVAEWIDYSWTNSKKTSRKTGQMLATVDDDEKFKATIQPLQCSTPSLHGGVRENTEMWFLTEDGLYEVLMLSRKPIAKAFKKEVKKILKELRMTGRVAPVQESPTAFEEMVLRNAKDNYNYNTYTATDLARCFGLSSQVINHFLLTVGVIKFATSYI